MAIDLGEGDGSGGSQVGLFGKLLGAGERPMTDDSLSATSHSNQAATKPFSRLASRDEGSPLPGFGAGGLPGGILGGDDD